LPPSRHASAAALPAQRSPCGLNTTTSLSVPAFFSALHAFTCSGRALNATSSMPSRSSESMPSIARTGRSPSSSSCLSFARYWPKTKPFEGISTRYQRAAASSRFASPALYASATSTGSASVSAGCTRSAAHRSRTCASDSRGTTSVAASNRAISTMNRG